MSTNMHKFMESMGEPINTFILPFVFTDKVVESVKSIWRCHNHSDHRLFLIDNGADDFSERKWLIENCHFYLKSYRNMGPAVAFNLGIQLARTKFVTIISDDARLVSEAWFQNTVRLIEESPDLIVSLNSIYPQKVPPEDFYQEDKNYSKEDYGQLERKYGSKVEAFGLATAIGRKETFIKGGLFPEDKYIYWIDGTFMARAKEKGVDFTMDGIVFHYGDASHKGRLVTEGKFHQVVTINNEAIL